MSNSKLKKQILCALFAALTAIFSQILIPLPFTPVPINLATLAIFLSTTLLGTYYGTLSQILYLLLGLVGLPVFAHFSGGASIVLGPTGGYLIGYVLIALVSGLLIELSQKQGYAFLTLPVALAAGMLFCYLPGTLWFMYVTHTKLLPALSLCVFPFLLGDALKIITATILTKKLKKHIS
ncbi:biotin transporter BioY [Anaerovorax sp. IOR16]|uniref:biotin transporter BioY n=1 Tax=Anaerovorax sp. IOR16 TaxID=2773458 RepID=UPI0019D14C66|nr:biotin transporter BioY [Anaerovorax sp. IOR16]